MEEGLPAEVEGMEGKLADALQALEPDMRQDKAIAVIEAIQEPLALQVR